MTFYEWCREFTRELTLPGLPDMPRVGDLPTLYRKWTDARIN